MISLSPHGSIAASCHDRKLLIAAATGHLSLAVSDRAMAQAFDDQVWLAEVDDESCTVTRYAETGEVLGTHVVPGGGQPIYMTLLPSAPRAAIIGLSTHTFTATLSDEELVIVEQVAHPARIIPAQRTVQIEGGNAILAGPRGANQLNRPDLVVSGCWPMMRGALLALVGQDQDGPAIDVVSLANTGRSIRLRARPNVLVSATRERSKLVMVDNCTLTVYDVIKRRFLMSRELRAQPVAIAVDGRGELLVSDQGNDTLEFIEIGRATSGHVKASATAVPDNTEPSEVRRTPTELMDVHGSMIDASFSEGPSDGEIVSRSPLDPRDVLGTFRYAASDVTAAVSAAGAAAPRWEDTRVQARISVLQRLEAELRARAPDLLDVMIRESGRPRWECSREIRGLLHRISYTAAKAKQVFTDAIDSVTVATVRRRPWGVTAVIGPAMLTLATSHQHIVAALLAGNTVVWKPSPLTAATAYVYTEALRGVDAPPGVINVVVGPDEVGAELAAHPDVDCVVFTGSRRNGSSVRDRWTASPSKHLVLHLGARNSAIVTEDSLIALAGYEIATSAFISTGQRCTAIRRVFAQREIVDELVVELRTTCRTLRIGGPDEGVFFGPMLSEQRLDDFQTSLAGAARTSTETVLRGERIDRPGYFITPSIYLFDRASGPTSEDSELFGPALFVHPVDEIDEAIACANAGADGLCAAVFTENDTTWERCANELEVGNIVRNLGTHSISGRLPFGGVKGSGLGGQAGGSALETLTRPIAMQTRQEYVLDIWPGTTPPSSATPLSGDDESELERREQRRAPQDETT